MAVAPDPRDPEERPLSSRPLTGEEREYLALLKAGHANSKLYVGGWNEWGNTPELPLGTQ